MKQKLAIARALVHEPPVLFLDEPTSGLDPEAAKTVRDFIETLKGQGRTIFLCTHNLDEAERLCDRIAVFRQKLIAVDTPEALRNQLFGRQTVVHLACLSDDLVQVVRELALRPASAAASGRSGAGRTRPAGGQPRRSGRTQSGYRPGLVSNGAQVQFVNELRHSLEDVYLSLMHNGDGHAGGAR